MPRTRTFTVARDVYSHIEPFKLELYYAKNKDELAMLLEFSSWTDLIDNVNPDSGCFVIHELVGPDMDRLSLEPVFPHPEDKE